MNISPSVRQCDAGLPVSAADAPAAIKCGGCGRDIPLTVSERAADGSARSTAAPSAAAPTSTCRKDFDPKVGLTVVDHRRR